MILKTLKQSIRTYREFQKNIKELGKISNVNENTLKVDENLLEEIYSYSHPMQVTTFWDKVFAAKLGSRYDKNNIYYACFAHYIFSIKQTIERDEAKKRGEDDPITGEPFEDLSDVTVPFDKDVNVIK